MSNGIAASVSFAVIVCVYVHCVSSQVCVCVRRYVSAEPPATLPSRCSYIYIYLCAVDLML